MTARPPIPDPSMDDAILSVLQAEQAARAAVDASAAQADALTADARRRARSIAERGARRVDRVHRAVERTIATRLEALEHERAELPRTSAPPPDEGERLANAIELLADELAGATG